ncbi:MAG: DNA translocase FtsK [Clostridiales Family XIII bacterium]|jgi:S-DNA-T family DNA segregation ATPase FtsK/SpoIIIE|nr:DNA translocase FtsK [Clostridiales Family XIII bacterium]
MATQKKKKTSSSKAKAKAQSQVKAHAVRQARIRREIAAVVCMAVGVFLVFALHAGSAGVVGDWFSAGLKGLFGAMAKALPFFLIGFGLFLLLAVKRRVSLLPVVLLTAAFVLLSVAFAVPFITAEGAIEGGANFLRVFKDSAAGGAGGVVGTYAAWGLVKAIGKIGVYILVIALIVICGILAVGVPLSQLAGKAREKGEAHRERLAQKRAEREALWEAAEAEEAAHREARTFTVGGGPQGQDSAPAANASSALAATSAAYAPSGFHMPSFLAGMFKTEPADRAAMAASSTGNGRSNLLDVVKNDETYGDLAGPRTEDAEAAAEQMELPLSGTGAATASATVAGASTAPEPDAPLKETILKGVEKGERPRKPNALKTADGDGKMHYMPSEANYKLPPEDLLAKPKNTGLKESPTGLKASAAKLEQALRDFRVEAKVAKVTVGPTVTRYEVEPDVGVRIQNIRSLEPDLALKLEVKSVRVVPMPGTSTVGIEAYNENSTIVSLRELIDCEEFRAQESRIAFALGKNISGKRIIADLAKMPHLLIAGTTGSGKSVCINSILLSLLYRAKPSELKLILIDPKVVELEAYSDIPHLLVPVVTDPERASMALAYAVAEMEKRYHMFSGEGVRNLDGYNEKLLREGRKDEVLPQIVIVIDELADLMIAASAKVQDSISRLAAKARAAGMHLIVATQQPLASILTSVIKANIPSRIALSVASNSASRVILDQPGAERLLGNGDMLFAPVGEREPMRIQGAFVSDAEVAKVAGFIKKQMDPDYSDEAVRGVQEAFAGAAPDEGDDEFFLDAVEMVADTKQASVSMIQRRFRIGYNRAARIVDMMEERGIVASSDGTNKPRRLIMTDAQLAGFLSSAGRGEGAPAPAPASPDSGITETQEEPPELPDAQDAPPEKANVFAARDPGGYRAEPAEPEDGGRQDAAPTEDEQGVAVEDGEGQEIDTGETSDGPDLEELRRFVTNKNGDINFADVFNE